jgi:hypothetical protein
MFFQGGVMVYQGVSKNGISKRPKIYKNLFVESGRWIYFERA